MKLTIGQTNRILDKLEDYGFGVIENESTIGDVKVISADYFNEKVNESLEEE